LVEDLLFSVLAALGEFAFELIVQILFELAVELVGSLLTSKRERPWTLRAVYLVLLGATAGLISAALFPHRMISGRHVVHGLSLVLAPIGAGIAMQAIGNRLRTLGRTPTVLTTFAGGAIFAFAMALVRWLIVARPL
jgi:hypothetical protein